MLTLLLSCCLCPAAPFVTGLASISRPNGSAFVVAEGGKQSSDSDHVQGCYPLTGRDAVNQISLPEFMHGDKMVRDDLLLFLVQSYHNDHVVPILKSDVKLVTRMF